MSQYLANLKTFLSVIHHFLCTVSLKLKQFNTKLTLGIWYFQFAMSVGISNSLKFLNNESSHVILK